jgi:Arc/MetJ-type ribon-helix-helix transcriptional regulator
MMGEPIRIRLTVTLPPEMAAVVEGMAAEMGISRGEVVRKAIRLLRFALDEGRAGNHLASLTPDLDIVQEVVDIVPADPPIS